MSSIVYTNKYYKVELNPEEDTNYDVVSRENGVVELKCANLPQALEVCDHWSSFLESREESNKPRVVQ